MKVKKITVEFDNGAIVEFKDEEIEALQKVRGILEFIDTSANIMKLAGFKTPAITASPFSFGQTSRINCGEKIDWNATAKDAKEREEKQKKKPDNIE